MTTMTQADRTDDVQHCQSFRCVLTTDQPLYEHVSLPPVLYVVNMNTQLPISSHGTTKGKVITVQQNELHKKGFLQSNKVCSCVEGGKRCRQLLMRY